MLVLVSNQCGALDDLVDMAFGKTCSSNSSLNAVLRVGKLAPTQMRLIPASISFKISPEASITDQSWLIDGTLII